MSFALSGCLYQVADSTDIKQAVNKCAEHQGVFNITIHFNGSEFAKCNDGYIVNVWER